VTIATTGEDLYGRDRRRGNNGRSRSRRRRTIVDAIFMMLVVVVEGDVYTLKLSKVW
jgi:hypothetical protein